MAIKSRGVNVILNSMFGIVATLVSTVMTFAVRTVLSRSLGAEIYGINTLFSSIITTLLIMELGISTAMTIFLYEPVANNDHEKIKTIIRLYRNIYRVFCTVLLCAGILVDLLVLPHMVASSIPIQKVQLYFVIFLASIIVKYLWYYKRSLLLANQRNRVSTGVTALCEAVFGGAEIVVLIYTQNYYLYLLLLIIQNILSNAICNIVVNRSYSFIKERNVNKMEESQKKSIVRIIKPMFVQRIAGTVQDSSVAVILSFLSDSVVAVGFYGNYQLITHTAQSLFSQIGAAFTTSIGNLSVTEDHTKLYQVYKVSRFIMNCLTIIITVCFFVLVQMFITIFFGTDYVLGLRVVLIIALFLYFYLNNIILISLQNAMGLHYLDAKQMVFQACSNIILSLVGGLLWGLEGILLGSLISVVVFSTFYKGIIIYKRIFKAPVLDYLKCLADEIVRFVISGVIVFLVMERILVSASIINWIIRAVVAIALTSLLWILLSFWRSEFSYCMSYLKKRKKKEQ